MSIYTFVNGVRKRAFTYNPRVKVDNAIKKIVQGYTFINGTRHKIFDEWSFINDKLILQDTSLTLPAGTYQFILRGAGGAGGTTGSSHHSGVPGSGGAGGKGDLVAETRILSQNSIVDIYVGEGGLRKSEDGNGGNGGGNGGRYDPGADGGDSVNGCGGGGGKPSFVVINNAIISANGGGGGGGGGGGAGSGRYSGGSGGGGGGGYYRVIAPIVETIDSLNTEIYVYLSQDGGNYVLSTTEPTGEIIAQWDIMPQDIQVGDMFNAEGSLGHRFLLKVNDIINGNIVFDYYYYDDPASVRATITINDVINERQKYIPQYENVAGKGGGGGGSGYRLAGANGIQGNITDFPDIYSGMGGTNKGLGGSGADGGGASGGGGGYGSGNHSSANGGDGGGGAGGSTDAGGGYAGRNNYPASNATNAKTTPTDTLAENSLYGVNANYGIGGGVNQNGTQGFVLIKRIA